MLELVTYGLLVRQVLRKNGDIQLRQSLLKSLMNSFLVTQLILMNQTKIVFVFLLLESCFRTLRLVLMMEMLMIIEILLILKKR